ncbi:hypothetical protein QJQ45_022186, partial [Haematococcus lacustris]
PLPGPTHLPQHHPPPGPDAAPLQHAASTTPGVLLARVFVDPAYHRTGFTLTSTSPSQLAQGVVHLSQTALSCLDLRQHSATHPRLGVVDHISLHPLHSPHPSPSQAPTPQQHPGPGPPSPAMAAAVQCGLAVAAALSQPPWLLPVFLYGALQAEGRRLADTRRGLALCHPLLPLRLLLPLLPLLQLLMLPLSTRRLLAATGCAAAAPPCLPPPAWQPRLLPGSSPRRLLVWSAATHFFVTLPSRHGPPTCHSPVGLGHTWGRALGGELQRASGRQGLTTSALCLQPAMWPDVSAHGEAAFPMW